MPYTSQHKARTRLRIVEAARRAFNRRGFLDVSIDDVMADAGLTRGGFYNHFPNKEALLVAALDHYSQCNPVERWDGVRIDAAADPETVAHQTIDAYLSSAHLDDIEGQCPLVALPAEVSRGGVALKARYRELVERMVDVHARGNGGHHQDGDDESEDHEVPATKVKPELSHSRAAHRGPTSGQIPDRRRPGPLAHRSPGVGKLAAASGVPAQERRPARRRRLQHTHVPHRRGRRIEGRIPPGDTDVETALRPLPERHDALLGAAVDDGAADELDGAQGRSIVLGLDQKMRRLGEALEAAPHGHGVRRLRLAAA